MIKHSIAEKLFLVPIREVFSGAFFGYSVLQEAPWPGYYYEVVFSLDHDRSPFTHELERHGIKIDMNMLNFKIYSHPHDGSNIEMVISNTKTKDRKSLIVPFDNSATALLLEAYATNSIGKIKEYLIDLIREAIKQK